MLHWSVSLYVAVHIYLGLNVGYIAACLLLVQSALAPILNRFTFNVCAPVEPVNSGCFKAIYDIVFASHTLLSLNFGH